MFISINGVFFDYADWDEWVDALFDLGVTNPVGGGSIRQRLAIAFFGDAAYDDDTDDYIEWGTY